MLLKKLISVYVPAHSDKSDSSKVLTYLSILKFIRQDAKSTQFFFLLIFF